MPARKSNVSAISNEDSAKAAPKEDGLSVEDLNLPKSIVQRLAKGVLPANTQVQKDALLAMSKSATVFVNYLTYHAAENAQRSNKKTVMPKDVFDAMRELEFEAMLPRLEAEVNKFTSIQADKRNTYRKKVREEKKAAKDKDEPTNGHGADEDSPPTKRARRSSVDQGEHNTGSEEEGDGDDTVDADEPEDEDIEDDEVEEEVQDEGLTEDPLEEREMEADDDEMADGNESD